jgi:hypothetical protein
LACDGVSEVRRKAYPPFVKVADFQLDAKDQPAITAATGGGEVRDAIRVRSNWFKRSAGTELTRREGDALIRLIG